MTILKSFLKRIFPLLDPIFAVFGLVGFVGVAAKRAMAASPTQLNLTTFTFRKLGYLPVSDHYYEPLTFGAIGGKYRERVAQLLFDGKKDFDFLRSISKPDEFKREYSEGVIREAGFQFGNGSFEPGDAETLYYFVRSLKPRKIVEIGAGHSSLIINAALRLNTEEGDGCEHIIIEPYENPWLEKLQAMVIRDRVELVKFSLFESLGVGDFVFIDSSHVVRAQNDCVFEYTELLPCLPSGVVVHVHDIFTPYDYPDEWLNKRFYLWAEQYVLEALLVNSSHWEILAALHWLSKDKEQFKSICPYFEEGKIPGSMWIRKL